MTRSQAARRAVAGAVVLLAVTGLTGCARMGGTSPASSSAAAAATSVFLHPSPYPPAGQSVPPAGSPTSGAATSPRVHVPVVVPHVTGPGPLTAATPSAAALAAVRAIKSSDTAVDADPHDTVQRAAQWLTPAYAAQVRSFPPVAGPGATWAGWAAHRAYLTVTTALGGDEHPTDTTTAAYRQVIAVLHPVGRDGWKGAAVTEVVSVSLARIGSQWRLASSQSS